MSSSEFHCAETFLSSSSRKQSSSQCCRRRGSQRERSGDKLRGGIFQDAESTNLKASERSSSWDSVQMACVTTKSSLNSMNPVLKNNEIWHPSSFLGMLEPEGHGSHPLVHVGCEELAGRGLRQRRVDSFQRDASVAIFPREEKALFASVSLRLLTCKSKQIEISRTCQESSPSGACQG